MRYSFFLIVFFAALLPFTFAEAWNPSGWAYEQGICLNSTVASNLSNFPAQFQVNTSALISAGQMNASCLDIRVVDAAKANILPYEIDLCNDTRANTTIWVSIPTLLAGQCTTVYLEYGNPGAGDDQKPVELWAAADYTDVYHLNGVNSGAGGQLAADSANHINLTGTGGGTEVFVPAQFGVGLNVSASNAILVDTASHTNLPSGNAPATMSTWINSYPVDVGTTTIVGGWGTWGGSSSQRAYMWQGGGQAFHSLFQSYGADKVHNLTPPNYAWQYTATNYNGSHEWLIQGANTSDYFAVNLATTQDGIGIGAAWWGGERLNGAIDEFRIRNVSSTPDWMNAERSQTYAYTSAPSAPNVSGYVLYPNGTGAVGATVAFENDSFIRLTTAGAGGYFNGVAWPGYANLTAFSFGARNYSSVTLNVSISGDTEQNLTLLPTIPVISGYVFYPNGTGAVGASIQYFNTGYWNLSSSGWAISTNATGRFSHIAVNANGSIRSDILCVPPLTCSQNFTTGWQNVTVAGDTEFNLTLRQYIPGVFGYVFYGNGSVAQNALVRAYAANGINVLNATNTSAAGFYNLTFATAEDLKVYAYNPASMNAFSVWNVPAANVYLGVEVNITVPFDISQVSLTNCSGVGDAYALNLSLWDEQTGGPVLNATIYSVNVYYTSSPSQTTNQSFNFSVGATNNASICINPGDAVVIDNAYLEVIAAGYSPRGYAFLAPLSNATQHLNIYLLNSNLSSQVNFQVVDQNSLQIPGVEVRVEEWIPATNSYLLVSSFISDYLGRGMAWLNVPNVQYRFLMLQNGTLVNSKGPSFIYCPSGQVCPPQPYSVILQLLPSQPPGYYAEQGKYDAACYFTAGTGNLICDALNIQGTSSAFNLVVRAQQVIAFNTTCNVTATGAAVTLVCNLGNYTGKFYSYNVYGPGGVWIGGSTLDFRGSTGINWGADALFLALILVLVLFFAFIVFGVEIGIITTGAGIVLAWMIGLVPVGEASIMGLVAIVVLTVYALGRK